MFISVSSSSPEWHNRCVGCAILSCLNREFMVFGFVCAYLNLIMNLYELLAIFELEFVHGIICKLWIRFATTSERFFDYTCVAVLVQPASIFFSSLISLFASLIPHKMLWNFAAHSIGGNFQWSSTDRFFESSIVKKAIEMCTRVSVQIGRLVAARYHAPFTCK